MPFPFWVWALSSLLRVKPGWLGLSVAVCSRQVHVCLVHSVKHIAWCRVGTSNFMEWMNEYSPWHLRRKFWISSYCPWKLRDIRSSGYFGKCFVTDVISMRTMDVFSPPMMRTKSWPHHWPSPLGDRVCGQCCTVTSCSVTLKLGCVFHSSFTKLWS